MPRTDKPVLAARVSEKFYNVFLELAQSEDLPMSTLIRRTLAAGVSAYKAKDARFMCAHGSALEFAAAGGGIRFMRRDVRRPYAQS